MGNILKSRSDGNIEKLMRFFSREEVLEERISNLVRSFETNEGLHIDGLFIDGDKRMGIAYKNQKVEVK